MKILRIPLVIVMVVLAGRAFNVSGQTLTILYSFTGPPNDGYWPEAGLVQGSDGNFYGTTKWGGTSTNCNTGCGTVFRISPSGTYTILYSFVGSPNDGANPDSRLVQGSDGNFYGTTQAGGTYDGGTVFRISPSGTETTLHQFGDSPSDGAYPIAGLVQGSDGNFYGTTYGGGANNAGTVFRISPSGTETTLHQFGDSPSDGAYPIAGLVQGSDGNFYGTTAGGGTGDEGTVFRISLGGTYTNLHSFVGYPNDGRNPGAWPVQGCDGNFYGTTQFGGTGDEGTVFQISLGGTYTNLHSFDSQLDEGFQPMAGLVQGSDGNFYGTTHAGGTNFSGDGGTVFRISPTGTYTNLYSLDGVAHQSGGGPIAGLVRDSDGNFYGTTVGYPEYGTSGTVFKVTVPLNPVPCSPPPWPINQITGVQLSGADIVFNVVSIAYETYQLQFSTDLTSGNWVNVPGVSVTNSIGALLTLTNFGGAVEPQGFYRFAITP